MELHGEIIQEIKFETKLHGLDGLLVLCLPGLAV